MNLSEALSNRYAEAEYNNIILTKTISELIVDIEVKGSLHCSNNQLTSLVINQPIGGWLDCCNNQLSTLEINQPIGGWLDCRNNQLTSLVINQPIGGWLDCYYNQLTSLTINHHIGGALDCSHNQLTSLVINQPIGGWLNCSHNQLTSLTINQPIGRSLDCSHNQLTSLTINHPIGGALHCSHNQLTSLTINHPIGGSLDCYYERLHEGDSGDNWVYLDDSLFIYKHKSTRKEYTIYTSFFSNWPTKYLVTNGKYSAHAKTIKQAILDIRFKEMDRNIDDYKGLTLDDKLTYEDAIMVYRVVTGACSGGTAAFLILHPELSTRKKYSVKEIIDLTSDQYGNEQLKSFFMATP